MLKELLDAGVAAIGRRKTGYHCNILELLNIRVKDSWDVAGLSRQGGKIDNIIIATMRGEIPVWLAIPLIEKEAMVYHAMRSKYAGASIPIKKTGTETEEEDGDGN